VRDLVYAPHIGLMEAKNRDGKAWGLSYNNQWFRMSFVKSLRISATVKY
jgi:hypothetical protein